MVVVCVLLLTAIGASAADLRQYVGIIRPEFNEQTKQLFLSLADMWKAQGQQDLADYFTNWAHGAWHGTGWVFVDSDGSNFIITNRHVAQQAERIDFQLEDPSGAVTSFNNCPILYVDHDIDLAVAQFPNGQKVYTQGFPINAGVQADGQEVWSAGYPGLLDQAGWQFARGNVTNGQARVPQLLDPKISYVIQHSASIDPGNSGGPLLLKNDKSPLGYDVVGVNTWGISNRQNTFFSIPGGAIRGVVDKARAARTLGADTAQLKTQLEKDAKILAAELGSESPDSERLSQFISYAFVGNLGYACWKADVATMRTSQEQQDSEKSFLNDPIETMRSSILRVFLTEMLLRGNNDLSSIEFLEISPADADRIGPGQTVRTTFTLKGTKVELQWVFEYGDWRVSYVNMQKFAQLLAGGSTGGAGGGGTGAAGTGGSRGQLFASSKRMGLEIIGGAGSKSGTGSTLQNYWIDNGSGLAWTAGMQFTVPFSPFLGMSGGVLAALKGANFDNTSYSPSLTVDYSITYVQVPVLVRAGLPFLLGEEQILELYAAAGLGVNFVVDTTGELSGYQYTSLTSSDFTDLNALAFSLLADIGLEYSFPGGLALGTAVRFDNHMDSDWSSASGVNMSFSNTTFNVYMKLLF